MRQRILIPITIAFLFVFPLLLFQTSDKTISKTSARSASNLGLFLRQPGPTGTPEQAPNIAQAAPTETAATEAPTRTRRPTRTPGPTSTPLTIPPPADMGVINAMVAFGVLSVIIVIIGVLINRNPRP